MTYDFAVKEATRRTDALGTIHYVVYAPGHGIDSYMVLSRMLTESQLDRYAIVDTIAPKVTAEQFFADVANNRNSNPERKDNAIA